MTKGIFFISILLISFQVTGQSIEWIKGTWNGESNVPGSKYFDQFVNTLVINKVDEYNYWGNVEQRIDDHYGAFTKSEISGTLINGKLTIQIGDRIGIKEPQVGYWLNCWGCIANDNKIFISGDSVYLAFKADNCPSGCGGTSIYSRKVSDFDIKVQQYLINHWGTEKQKRNFTFKKSIDQKISFITPEELKREIKNLATYETTVPDIQILIYDNATIDNDTISLYHNNKLVINRQPLKTIPIEYLIKATNDIREHSFILVANNLGNIPPNTALLYVITGDRKYELHAKTNMKENAKITIKYTGNQ